MKRTVMLVSVLVVILEAGRPQAPLFEVVRSGPPVEEHGLSRGAAWGDFDGDGDADLFVTRPTWEGRVQHNALYRNHGAGRFTRVAGEFGTPAAWEGAAWIDVDDDGDLDLHLTGRDGAGSSFFENDGAGALAQRADVLVPELVVSASMGCWADADGDGRLDVFVVGYGAGRNALFRNLGQWRFEPVPLWDGGAGDGSARACAWGDLDGDGLPELAIANARRPNSLLRNHGAMRLLPDTTTALQRDSAYGYGVSFTDVNGDGERDLFVANFDAGNSLYLGAGDGTLTLHPLGEALQSAATKGHVWGDFDLDGRTDAYLGSGTPRPGMLNRTWLGRDGGGFRLVDEGDYATHADTSAAVAGADYDLDGDIDLFVANWGSHGSVNRIYRNTANGRWLKVTLRGERSNRMGIGARASVLIEGRWMHRWLDASTGYAGQNEPVLHFGLGHATAADSLVVSWPSGTVDRVGRVAADVTVDMREGTGRIGGP